MKKIGYILIMVSFLSGSFLTALDPTKINWVYFVPALIVGFIGLAMLKSENKKAAQADHKLEDDLKLMDDSLQKIVANLQQLNQQREELPTYEARFEIDRRFREDLDHFANVRESMRHLFGLQTYADIMSAFAAGERYVNRVWSASTDGYVDEVKMYLTKAYDQFVEAQQKFSEAKNKA
ncbi:hypothetical protein [Aliikangiella coralliicola]|uniref:Uncharacterized protein n=1 Tax=Aliikangiella coralliicola TaxID=2592383 RepID=A0A545UFE5_9GAMM|nr:hypothetical protein [Aliikangiella coralliicola]TQV88113.1 hypothetical protein FLL46_06190 [Aliikangiella coralliicola]